MTTSQSDAERIVRALGGRWTGRSGICRCPAHDDRTPSLSVATGHDGRLLLNCFTGCAFEDVVAALRGRGILEGSGRIHRPDPAEVARQEAEERAEREKRTRQARAIWAESLPIYGTLGERYLRRRGITGPMPPALRFHPSCWHKSAKRLPALVAAVMDLRGEMLACHRTYLAEPGAKAAVDPPRLMLGPVAGAAVHLSDGAGPVLVGEGIESTWSAFILRGDRTARAWAALSAGGMEALHLPPQPGRLVIAPDADARGRTAAQTLAERAHVVGWAVSILEPPPVGDFNDALRGGRAA